MSSARPISHLAVPENQLQMDRPLCMLSGVRAATAQEQRVSAEGCVLLVSSISAEIHAVLGIGMGEVFGQWRVGSASGSA